jgi:hypothetical protein
MTFYSFSKFGRFNEKLMMTKQMAHIFSLSILSKKTSKPSKDTYATNAHTLEMLN